MNEGFPSEYLSKTPNIEATREAWTWKQIWQYRIIFIYLKYISDTQK